MFKSIEFLDISAFIINQHWQSSRILISLCKYCIVISDTVENSFLAVHFWLLAVILSELHEKPRRKDWIIRKEYMEEFVWGISLFWLHAPLSVFFCCFLRVLPPSSQVTPLRNDPYKDRYLTMGGILCDDIISKRSKIWKSIIYKQCFFPTRPQCCLAFS